MPSKSPAQAHFMGAVAHNPGFAKKAGVPQSVGKEFNKADQLAKAHALRNRKPKAAPSVPDADNDGY